MNSEMLKTPKTDYFLTDYESEKVYHSLDSRFVNLENTRFPFEFGRGFYQNTYTSVLSGLTLTPGPLQIFCNCKRGKLGRPGNEADLRTVANK